MNQESFNAYQFQLAVTAFLLTKVFHIGPRSALLTASTAAPWVGPVVAATAFLLFWPVVQALSRRPGRGLVDLSLEAGGRPLAVGVALVLCAWVVVTDGLTLRQVSEMAVTAIYPHTPQTWLMISLLLASALGAALTPAGMIWGAALYTGPALLAILVVLVGNLGWSQFDHLLPATGPGLLPLAGQVLPLTSCFADLVMVSAICPYLDRPERLVRATAWAVGLTALIEALVTLVFVSVFTASGGLAVPFPFYEMTRLVMGGRFMERMDALWILVWTFGSAGQLSTRLMFGSLLFRDAFRLPDHRGAILPMASAVLAAALFPSNQSAAIRVEHQLLNRWGFLVTLLLPLAVALVAELRRRHSHA